MGVWKRESDNRYSSVLEFFRFSADEIVVGTQRVTRKTELSAGENDFTSTSEIQNPSIRASEEYLLVRPLCVGLRAEGCC